MKGLILKDFYNLGRQNKVILAAIAFYLIFSLANKDSSFFGGMLTFLMVMQTMTAMAYDEKSKWDRYALAMPVSRTDMVLSKYILGVILLVIAFAANLIFMVATGTEPVMALNVSLVMAGIGLFSILVTLPVLFKFGMEKGRYIIMLIFLIPTVIGFLGPKMGLKMPDESFMRLLPVLGLLILIISGIVSVSISLAVYKRKEM